MRGVISHDWVEPRGGAEVVLNSLIKAISPEKVFVTWNADSSAVNGKLFIESWLAKTFLRGEKFFPSLFFPTYGGIFQMITILGFYLAPTLLLIMPGSGNLDLQNWLMFIPRLGISGFLKQILEAVGG